MSKNSERMQSESPIFFEALGAFAHCKPFDAAEHFDAVLTERRGDQPVTAFLNDYAVSDE